MSWIGRVARPIRPNSFIFNDLWRVDSSIFNDFADAWYDPGAPLGLGQFAHAPAQAAHRGSPFLWPATGSMYG